MEKSKIISKAMHTLNVDVDPRLLAKSKLDTLRDFLKINNLPACPSGIQVWQERT